MPRRSSVRSVSLSVVLLTAVCACSCDIPVGPGYTIEQQAVEVHFRPAPEPRIEIQAAFVLRNTGDEALKNLEIHLPPEERVHLQTVSVRWETQDAAFARQKDAGGDILRIDAGSWAVKQTRTLRVEYVIVPGEPDTQQMHLAPDGFYLPPDVWLAAPMKPRGNYGSGGTPPSNWTLEVKVPGDFAVQASGERGGLESREGEQVARYQQHFPGITPFVIAGRYQTREYKLVPYVVNIWSKGDRGEEEAQRVVGEAASAAKTYDAVFGPREERRRPLWIAERPVAGKELAARGEGESWRGKFYLGEPPEFAFVKNFSAGRTGREAEEQSEEIAESLSRRWLGYGLSGDPRLLPQPMGSLPAYAARLAREAQRGPQARKEIIAEGLREYAEAQSSAKESSEKSGEKSKDARRGEGLLSAPKNLLFFFALEDQFGRDKLHAALQHMVQARRGRGYDLRDMIAALEQETKRNAAEFVRGWIKHPGIPADFIARYQSATAK